MKAQDFRSDPPTVRARGTRPQRGIGLQDWVLARSSRAMLHQLLVRNIPTLNDFERATIRSRKPDAVGSAVINPASLPGWASLRPRSRRRNLSRVVTRRPDPVCVPGLAQTGNGLIFSPIRRLSARRRRRLPWLVPQLLLAALTRACAERSDPVVTLLKTSWTEWRGGCVW
jgi:hypothetical protein